MCVCVCVCVCVCRCLLSLYADTGEKLARKGGKGFVGPGKIGFKHIQVKTSNVGGWVGGLGAHDPRRSSSTGTDNKRPTGSNATSCFDSQAQRGFS